jgi:hypothetical protein
VTDGAVSRYRQQVRRLIVRREPPDPAVARAREALFLRGAAIRAARGVPLVAPGPKGVQ